MHAIAIDFGGTKIEEILCSDEGKILYKTRHPTGADKNSSVVISNIAKVIADAENFAVKNKISVKGIGISHPGFTMPGGKISSCENIPSLMGVDLRKELEKRLPKYKNKIILENDADCFALAEYKFGSARKHRTKNIIGVIVGTGLGFGLILGGKPFHGSFGGAGEFGHSFFEKPTKTKEGTFEGHASGPWLEKRYKIFGGSDKSITIMNMFGSKDRTAQNVIELFYDDLGKVLSYVINMLNPEVVVIGGGVSRSIDYKRLRKKVEKYTYKTHMNGLKILKHSISDSAGALGAAVLVFGDV